MAKTPQERRAAQRQKQRQRRHRPDRGRPVLALVASSVIVVGGVVGGLWATGAFGGDDSDETVEVATAASASPEAGAESPSPTVPPEPTVEPTPVPEPTDIPASPSSDSSEPTSTTVIGEGADAPDPVSSLVIGNGADAADRPPKTAPTAVPVAAASGDNNAAEGPEPTTVAAGGGSVSVFCSDSLTDGVTRPAVISWSASNPGGAQTTANIMLGGVEIARESLAPGASISRSITLPDASSVAKVVSLAVNGATIGSATVPWC